MSQQVTTATPLVNIGPPSTTVPITWEDLARLGAGRYQVTYDTTPIPWLAARSPLEQTLDLLVAASQDLAQAIRDHHAASTEPVA